MGSLLNRWKDRPRFERQSAWALLAAANGRSPRRHNRVLQIPSFFLSWLTIELAFPSLLLSGWRTARAIRRGDAATPAGKAAVAAQVVAAGAAVSFIVEGRRTDEQFAAALAPWLTREELDDRPHSVRLGAWIPLLYGGRKRRKRTRNIVFTPADGPRIALDVYQPLEALEPGAKRPAIVQIHGGAWVIGDKREQGVVARSVHGRQCPLPSVNEMDGWRYVSVPPSRSATASMSACTENGLLSMAVRSGSAGESAKASQA